MLRGARSHSVPRGRGAENERMAHLYEPFFAHEINMPTPGMGLALPQIALSARADLWQRCGIDPFIANHMMSTRYIGTTCTSTTLAKYMLGMPNFPHSPSSDLFPITLNRWRNGQ